MEVPRHSPGRDSGNCAAAFSLATGPALGLCRWLRLRFPLDQSPTLLQSQSTCCPFLTGLISICSLFEFPMKNKLGERQRRESLSWLMQENYVVYSSHLSGPFPLLMAFFPEESHGYWFQPVGFDPWLTVLDHRSPKICTRGPTTFRRRRENMSCLYYISNDCGEKSPSISRSCVTFDISPPILSFMFCVRVVFCVGQRATTFGSMIGSCVCDGEQ